MKSFLTKLFLFMVPLSIYLLPVFWLIYCREVLVNYNTVAGNDQKYIFGLAYSEIGRQFKFANVQQKKRFDVIAVGSSRVMQFREEMFTKKFYNAGGTTQSIGEFESFLKAVPKEKLPPILIVGLDQWMFNSAYQRNYEKQKPFSWSDLTPVNKNIGQKVKEVVKDYNLEKIDFSSTYRPSNKYKFYGINAVMQGNGFRNDGSYLYETFAKQLMSGDTSFFDFKFRGTFERINKGCCRFDYGDSINLEAVTKLESLLAFCKSNSIYVVAIMPPFAAIVYTRMLESGKFNYVLNIYPAIKPLFDKYNYELYDFSHMENARESIDAEMIDGYHGGEIIYSTILIEMLNSGSKLKEVSDLEKLKSDLRRARDRYVVYEY